MRNDPDTVFPCFVQSTRRLLFNWTMAYAKSSLEIEIQDLKEELAVSQKKVDRYAHRFKSAQLN